LIFSAFFQNPCCGDKKYPSLGDLVAPNLSWVFKVTTKPVVTIAEAKNGSNRILII
jgi:hypothetical protein